MASGITKLIRLRNIKHTLKISPNETPETSEYLISGWIKNFRFYKSVNFIELVDGSTKDHIQLVVKRDILNKPDIGAFLSCRGSIVPSRGNLQPSEFKVSQVDYFGPCDNTSYPIPHIKHEAQENISRKHMHLRPRTPNFQSMLRLRSELELSLHMIMKQMDFFKVHTPCLTSNDSEATSDLFKVTRTKLHRASDGIECKSFEETVDMTSSSKDSNRTTQITRVERSDYFNKDVFLITSAQLHLESLAAGLSRVYCLSPAFRAENSLTRRHLCEFLMFEAEESNLLELDPLMDRVESIVKFAGQYLCEVSEFKDDFQRLVENNQHLEIFNRLSTTKFIRMDYQEALRILNEENSSDLSLKFGDDIGRVQEQKLLQYTNQVPIFIKNYPKTLKPFYMKSNDQIADSFDLIAPIGGEICGGSLREDCPYKLMTNLSDMETKQQSDLDWYIDLRRYGSYPHGGFGIGFERLIQALIGTRNIKDTMAFPRWAGHCSM